MYYGDNFYFLFLEQEVHQENYENPDNHDDDGMESIEKGSVEMNDMGKPSMIKIKNKLKKKF